MATKRMINCDFVNASAFKVEISNRGKLLYLYMLTNADDKGFVDKAQELVATLQENESAFENQGLAETTYDDSLNELVDKGLLFVFENKHKNKIYLIRHWFFHNKWIKGLETNYTSLAKLVETIDNEYCIKEKDTKEKSTIKLNQSKTNNIEQNIVEEDDIYKLPF